MTAKEIIDKAVNILRKDPGISGSQVVEQLAWIIFLKYLNDRPDFRAMVYKGEVSREYTWEFLMEKVHSDGYRSYEELSEWVHDQFSYFQKWGYQSGYYRVGEIFEILKNRFESDLNLAEVLHDVNGLDFSQMDSDKNDIFDYLLSKYPDRRERVVPENLIRTLVRVLHPSREEKIYDGAFGQGDFLIAAYKYLKKQNHTGEQSYDPSQQLYGAEKNGTEYALSLIHMMMTGLENPNVYQRDPLYADGHEERYDVILSFPPFGYKDRDWHSTMNVELKYLLHYMKDLDRMRYGRAAVILPEKFFLTMDKEYIYVREKLLNAYNLHTVLSLPAGAFAPYTRIKTSVLFFDTSRPSSSIWYYECGLESGKNKTPGLDKKDLKEFERLFESRESNGRNAWMKDKKELYMSNIAASNPYLNDVSEMPEPEEVWKDLYHRTQELRSLYDDFFRLTERIFSGPKVEDKNEEVYKTKLGDMVTVLRMGVARSSKTEEAETVNYLTMNDIDELGRIRADVSHVVGELNEDQILRKGSLVLINVGTKIGQLSYVEEDLPLLLGGAFMLIQVNENIILPHYLLYYWWYLKAAGYLDRLITRGTTQQKIITSNVRELEIIYPPLHRQREIVEKLNKVFSSVDDLICKEKERIENFSQLKNALLGNIFR